MARPRIELLEGRLVMSALTPAQLTGAYGLNAVNYSGGSGAVRGNGSGQTIAIVVVDHDANLAAELGTFDAQYGLASPALTVINQAGSTANSGWAQEEAMDVEWAHAAAPGANLVVVEAASSGVADLVTAINTARTTAGVSVVSMSFGTPEFSSEANYDGIFTTPTGHTGITFLASSGDNGVGAQWPACSPHVVAVGGTSLALNASGQVAGETAWAGSGGGPSQYEAEPSFQASVQSSGRRTGPDVALDADPATGASVYSVAAGGWIQAGGTSLASPVWAGLIAVADQGRALNGLGTLDGATQTLPALYAAPAGAFNDITAGSRATAGYDTATGLGTPNAAPLVAALGATPLAATTPTAPVAPVPIATTPTTTTTTITPTTSAPTPTPTSTITPVAATAPATNPFATAPTYTTTAIATVTPIGTTRSHHKAVRKPAHSRHAHANILIADTGAAETAATRVTPTPAGNATAHHHRQAATHQALDAVLAGYRPGRHSRSAR